MDEEQEFTTGDGRTVRIDIAGGPGLTRQEVLDLAELHAQFFRDLQKQAGGFGMPGYSFPVLLPEAERETFLDALKTQSGGNVTVPGNDGAMLFVVVSKRGAGA